MLFDVLKVNKSIYRCFRSIRVHLVLQKIDVNPIVSKIATKVKPTIKDGFNISDDNVIVACSRTSGGKLSHMVTSTDLQLMDGWPGSDKPVIAWRRLKPQEVLVG